MAYIYGRIKSVSERKTHDGQNAVTLRVMTDSHHLVDVRVDDVKGSVQINRWVSLYGSFSGEGGRRFFHASMLALPRFSQFKESERQWKPYEVGGTVVTSARPRIPDGVTASSARRTAPRSASSDTG
ncbi:MAG: hypothetical protein IJ904_01385 [Candidatus Methanomethylophilaceae archaeon]|nr:hypothetical protein [Candidatus Methanomethylophilaceae archaeon]